MATVLIRPLLLLLLHISTSAVAARPLQSSCTTTIYPRLCYTSLATSAPSVQSNPKLLAAKSLSVALSSAKSASSAAWRLVRSRPRGHQLPPSVSDCAILLADAVNQLHRSTASMAAAAQVMGDVQTWASAAMTDENTCLEELGGPPDMYGNPKVISLRKQVVEAAQLTSNALALVNAYGSTRSRPRHHHRPHHKSQNNQIHP